ncbi:MAG TPA: GLPGLI family protein [Lutibacter sp.]|nr:GLPGLI family protein [Lutibacter sp.]
MKYSLTLFILFLTFSIQAQNFQGYAIYESKTTFEMEMDSSKFSKERMDMMKAMMKKFGEKSFILSFDKTQSIYKEEEKLDKPTSGRGMRIFGNSTGILYKDIKLGQFVNQIESFSKLFLIKDSLPNYAWKLEKDTKMIGEHLCFKATTTKEVSNRKMRMGRRNNTKENDSIPKTKIIEVTAWYTPDIPINNGPEKYVGLPGLILEINQGKTTLLCTKIVLNPKEKQLIKAPSKGKKVTQKEHDEITEKKAKEMMEMYGGGRKKGSGNRHIIRMGG